jgi:hypothetical protein
VVKRRINHATVGNWWVEARILGVFLTGPLLANQKYLADGEAFFAKGSLKVRAFYLLVVLLGLN